MARPLTRIKKSTDSVYTRPAGLDARIDSLLELATEVICERARLRSKESGVFVPSECLVHLVREARRASDVDRFEKLFAVLLKRCEDNLLNKIAESIPGAHELREEVLADFTELFAREWEDEHANKLDFYEVRFQQAFAALRNNKVRAELRRLKPIRPLPEPDISSGADEDWDTGLQEFGSANSADGLAGLDFEWRELVNSLPLEQKQAFVLCKILGYQEESINPDEPTASSLLKVTPRTIRNRLARALATLRGKVEEKT